MASRQMYGKLVDDGLTHSRPAVSIETSAIKSVCMVHHGSRSPAAF